MAALHLQRGRIASIEALNALGATRLLVRPTFAELVDLGTPVEFLKARFLAFKVLLVEVLRELPLIVSAGDVVVHQTPDKDGRTAGNGKTHRNSGGDSDDNFHVLSLPHSGGAYQCARVATTGGCV